MAKRKKTKRPLLSRLTKRPLLGLSLLAVLLIAGGFTYAQFKDNQPSNPPGVDNSANQDGQYINLNPPTDQDKKEAETNKKNLTEDTPSPIPQTSNGKKQVTPVITSASRTAVYAYVPGIFEEGGKCMATATKGSQTESTSSSGFADVNKTSCAPLYWSLSGSGWSVTVSYSSSTAQGKSEPQKVN